MVFNLWILITTLTKQESKYWMLPLPNSISKETVSHRSDSSHRKTLVFSRHTLHLFFYKELLVMLKVKFFRKPLNQIRLYVFLFPSTQTAPTLLDFECESCLFITHLSFTFWCKWRFWEHEYYPIKCLCNLLKITLLLELSFFHHFFL